MSLLGADGNKTISYAQTDAAGNSASASRVFVKDTTAPDLSITGPAVNSRFQNALTLSGTCETGGTIAFSGNITAVPTLTCASGAFTQTLSLTGGDGAKTVSLLHTDGQGNQTSLSRVFERDTVLPILSLSSPATNTESQSTISLVGSCGSAVGDNGTLEISGADLQNSPVTANCSSGAFSQSVSLIGSEGAKTVTISQKDEALNTSAVSRVFVKDTVAPTLSFVSPAVLSVSQGSVTLTGTCETGLTVSVSGDLTSSTTTCAGSSFSANVSLDGLDGVKSVIVSQTDSSGNTGSVSRNLVKDTLAPSLTIASPGAGYRDQAGASISGTCESGLTINITGTGVSSGSASCLSGSYTYNILFTGAEGNKVVNLTQTDLAGNVGNVSRSFVKDVTAPAPLITSPAANFATQSSLNITGDCGSSLGDDASVTLSGSFTGSPVVSSCSSGHFAQTLSLTGADGVKTISVSQGDSALNISSSSINYIKDSVAPVLSISLPSANSSTQSALTISGSCEAGLTVQISGDTSSTSTTCSAGSFSTALTLSGADGVKTITLSQTDSAGNIGSVSRNFIKDNAAPVLTSVIINAGDAYVGTPLLSVVVQGTDASTMLGKVAEASGVDCQASFVDSSWVSFVSGQTFNLLVPAVDGTKKICAWLKDSAGNIFVHSPAQGVDQVTYDTIQFQIGNPPQVSSLVVTNNTAGGNFGTTTFALGNQVKISYTISDTEGLSNSPISIYYSTNNSTWTPIVTNYGSLTGNPTTWTNDYLSFNAPTASFFRIKIVAKDSSGNTSIPIVSDTLNSGNWSVYAGVTDRGLGGSATAISLAASTGPINRIAFHPKTGDLYVIDFARGLVKLDVKTGLTSQILANGSTTLSTSGGAFLATTTINTGYTEILFDKAGYLYIKSVDSLPNGGGVFKLDLVNSTSTRVLGGGTINDSTATASTVLAWAGGMAFDESENLYFFTNCTPGTWLPASGTVRLLKATRNPDSSFGSVTTVAGNCVRGLPAGNGPYDPLTSPITNSSYPALGTIAAFNNGNSIYFSGYGTPLKVINGVLYKANVFINTRGMMYNPATNKLFATYGALYSCTIPATGVALGEVCTNLFSATTSGACTADNILASTSCAQAYTAPTLAPDGTMFFTDGSSTYRVRYIGSDNKIRTFLGSLPFMGDGLHRSLIRGKIQSIYYKKASEPEGTTYPEGLYFGESTAPVFGYINPATGLTSVIWGNQSGGGAPAANDAASTSVSLGAPYGDYDGAIFTFDSTGLPWMRANQRLVKLNSSKQVQLLQSGGTMWNTSTEGSAASLSTIMYYGLTQNLVLKGQSTFLIGAYTDYTATYATTYPVIKQYDFGLDKITRLMGGTGTGVGSTADNATAGSVLNSTLPTSCYNAGICRLQYRSDQDRLYMTDGAMVRYITQPTNTAASTLATLFTGSAGNINNFTFRPDNTQVFYQASGKVYCHDISSGKAWCNDTALGPNSPMTIGASPANAFTWIDNNTMLISTGLGEVYKYNLLP